MAKSRKTDYNVSDEAEGGAIIGTILGSAPHFIAFFTPESALRWEIDDARIPSHFPACIERFDAFQSMIDASVPRMATRRALRRSLGLALYGAVVSAEADAGLRHFDAIAKRIEASVAFHARVYYVASSVTSAVVVVSTLATLWRLGQLDGLEPYILAAGAGCCGAAISVLLRAATVRIPAHSSPAEHFFRGLSRTVLGLLSGAALASVIEGNLLLGRRRTLARVHSRIQPVDATVSASISAGVR